MNVCACRHIVYEYENEEGERDGACGPRQR